MHKERNVFMKLLILSLDQAITFKPMKDIRTSIIRILEPDSEQKSLEFEQDFEDILELKFHDILGKLEGRLLPNNIRLFDDNHAHKTIEFFKKNKEVDMLVIHCFAGVSRSPAIALSFTWFLENSILEKKIIESRKYVPNPHVMSKMATFLDVYDDKLPLIEKFTFDDEEEEFKWDDY